MSSSPSAAATISSIPYSSIRNSLRRVKRWMRNEAELTSTAPRLGLGAVLYVLQALWIHFSFLCSKTEMRISDYRYPKVSLSFSFIASRSSWEAFIHSSHLCSPNVGWVFLFSLCFSAYSSNEHMLNSCDNPRFASCWVYSTISIAS